MPKKYISLCVEFPAEGWDDAHQKAEDIYGALTELARTVAEDIYGGTLVIEEQFSDFDDLEEQDE